MTPSRSFSPRLRAFTLLAAGFAVSLPTTRAQLVDRTLAPNLANEGIAKSFADQNGAGRGDVRTPNSSAFIIARDPFRAIRRGRQIFQRKFLPWQGLGPITSLGQGDVANNIAIGAGLSDSCASCHGRPRGSAGVGGDVATRPDSRDSPHLFGIGLKEMLGDEFTTALRAQRTGAIDLARRNRRPVTVNLAYQGISYGSLTANADGSVDTSRVVGVDPDLRVRPFFAHGEKFTIRESLVGALNDEMGLQSVDAEMVAAKAGGRMVTPAGMVLDGSRDRLQPVPTAFVGADPDGDGVTNEIPTATIDFLEFYLLNYFKPATYEQTPATLRGRAVFAEMQCVRCHVPDLTIQQDRRVADVETTFDSERGIFNGLFATAEPKFNTVNDGSGHPVLKTPKRGLFVVKNIFTDLRRHDLGPKFYERTYGGTQETTFMTAPLWGVGTSAPYGHDGRSINLPEVILRHGGEAAAEAARFAALSDVDRSSVLEFLQSLVLFPPDDTASNLDPGNRSDPRFPQAGHGSIRLGALFNNPADPE